MGEWVTEFLLQELRTAVNKASTNKNYFCPFCFLEVEGWLSPS
jgi:hypothetical protein